MNTEHASPGHGTNGRPVHLDVRFEKTDVRTAPILRFLLYLAVLIVFSYLLTLGFYRGLKNNWADSYTPPPPSRLEAGPTMPPEPRMQGMPGHLIEPQSDLQEKIQADKEANSKLAWVDEKAGIAQIPVKDAMQWIVERGLPAVTASPAEKK
jgi:hypothetical protein